MVPGALALAVVVSVLEPGVPVQHTIGARGADTFGISVEAGQWVTGSIEQGDVDLALDLQTPGGQPVATYDGRERGVDLFTFLAAESGTYSLVVRRTAPGDNPAPYGIRVEPGDLGAADGARLVEAERLTTQAKQLFARGVRNSLLEALACLSVARPLWNASNQPSLELATVAGTGDAFYLLSEYAKAEAAYTEALGMSRRQVDRRTEVEVMNNLAMVEWPLGKIPDALRHLEQALTGWRELKHRYGEASSLSNRGILLKEIGEFDEARQHYQRARAIFRSLRNVRGEALAINNTAMALDALGKPAEALTSLRQATTLFRRVGDRLAEGRALLLEGRIRLGMGRRQTARSRLQQGLPLVRAAGDKLAEADGLHTLGRVLAADGDHAGARAEFERALTLHRDIGSRRGEADDLHDTAVSLLATGDCATARDLLSQGLDVRRATGLRRPEADTLFWLAKAERACGDLAAAQTHLEGALALTEQLRSGVIEQDLRTSYLTTNLTYYSTYVDVLVARHRSSPGEGFDRLAFSATEQARAREAVERLKERWATDGAVGDPSLRARERDLRAQVNYWSWQVWQQADRSGKPDQIDALRASLARVMAERSDAEAQLHRSDPRFAALTQVEPVEVATVQRELLDDQTVLLEYMLGDERSYVWVVTSDSVATADLPPRADIERRALGFYRFLSAPRDQPPTADALASGSADARYLARVLLGPAASVLTRRRVLVVPDGALNYIPFGALVDPQRGTPLTAEHEVVAAPSSGLALMLQRQAQRSEAPKALAVLADPVFDVTDPRVRVDPAVTSAPAARGPAPGIPSRRLSRLPFSRDEAERILRLVPANSRLQALNFDANRATAVSANLAQYRIVHFATHAIQDDEHPELSGIVLSLVGANGRPQDGFLRIHDLYGLHLRADLVVLSACETGIGRQTGREGLASLARGFFFAGATRVMSSLWKVDDEATARLMELFYKALLNDPRQEPAAALRAAQNEMQHQKRWADPHYWSGFVLQGSGR